jgi:hypothetical protein
LQERVRLDDHVIRDPLAINKGTVPARQISDLQPAATGEKLRVESGYLE